MAGEKVTEADKLPDPREDDREATEALAKVQEQAREDLKETAEAQGELGDWIGAENVTDHYSVAIVEHAGAPMLSVFTRGHVGAPELWVPFSRKDELLEAINGLKKPRKQARQKDDPDDRTRHQPPTGVGINQG